MSASLIRVPTAAHQPSRSMAVVFGMVGALLAACFVVSHWSLALIGALVVLFLSATENETFLLMVIALTPISWVLSGEALLHNVPDGLRFLVIVGFFSGRLFRGGVNLKGLFRHSITKASLSFLCAALAPLAFVKGARTPESAASIFAVASFIGFSFVVLAWVDSQERLKKVLQALLWSTIATSIFAIAQEMIGGYTSLWLRLNPPNENSLDWEGRATSFLNYSNSLAGYLNVFTPLALGCAVLGEARWKKLGAWTLGLAVIALACTQSLGGLAGFCGILILALFCFVENRAKRFYLLAALVCSFIGLYVVRDIINPAHADALLGIDAVGRLLMWGLAWNFFIHSPIFGIGWGNFRMLYGSELHYSWLTPDILDVHNVYLQLLAETGIFGFVTFFSFILLTVRDARAGLGSSSDPFRRILAFTVLGAIVAMLVHGCVDFLFRVSPQFGTAFWVVLALGAASAGLEGTSRLPVEGVSN